jgi:hypothetical protein
MNIVLNIHITYIHICIYLYHILFIHSSFGGHLNCSCVFNIVNNAVTNMEMQISLKDSAFILVHTFKKV